MGLASRCGAGTCSPAPAPPQLRRSWRRPWLSPASGAVTSSRGRRRAPLVVGQGARRLPGTRGAPQPPILTCSGGQAPGGAACRVHPIPPTRRAPAPCPGWWVSVSKRRAATASHSSFRERTAIIWLLAVILFWILETLITFEIYSLCFGEISKMEDLITKKGELGIKDQ